MARLVVPPTLEEACGLLEEAPGEAVPLAGGTALQMLRRRGEFAAGTLVDLRRVPGLDRLQAAGGGVSIGALVTHRRIESDPVVRRTVPVLADMASQIANVRVRNAATLGGNLAHRDHRLDPPGVLMVLGATVELASRHGRRTVPVGDLFTGCGDTVLAPGELVVAVHVPAPPPGARAAFAKYKSLGANDWPCAAVAACLSGDDGRRTLDLGLTAVSPSPAALRLDVSGLGLAAALDQADAAVSGVLAPVSDLRGSARFKARVTRVLCRDTIDALWEGPQP
ncbi:MAG TPA: FAD binding domain-containing protein [Acidimicrobiales bacterium]|nr:FAD binding domain-containing protein [Acidimicrobiales bacterium]